MKEFEKVKQMREDVRTAMFEVKAAARVEVADLDGTKLQEQLKKRTK